MSLKHKDSKSSYRKTQLRRKKTRSVTRKTDKLSLYDRLSQLTYRQACGILGPDGALLLRRPYPFDELDVQSDIYLGEDLFRLSMHESWIAPATVTMMLAPAAKFKLAPSCSCCNPQKVPNRVCEHIAATLSFLLEEKSLIGLADLPDLETPPELLSPKKLFERAMHERAERAKNEKFRITPIDRDASKSTPWSDYLVTAEISGKTYRVALRGTQPGDSYCSCPDFKTNRLGTCKHILHLLRRMEKRFGKASLEKPHLNTESFVYLRYGEERTLHLAIPDGTDECDCDECKTVMKIAKPFLNKAVNDVKGLLRAVTRLESAGETVAIYPDAEEWIRERLFKDRMTELVAEIRTSPKRHPLRKSLLDCELLPYQLDGIAFAVGAGRAILADEMGLGKTIQGVGVAELLAREADIKKVLVVCPASVKSQWHAEINRFAKHRSVQLVLGGAQERYEQYDNDTFFTICNYEQVLRDLQGIERVRWDLIILDEGQRIKNWEAKTTQTIKCLRSPYALVLTGTPMENRLDELYSVVQFVDDRRLLPAYRFFHRHRIVEDSGRIAGYKNLDEIREQLKPILLRRTKESVALELPERSTEVLRIAPTEEQLDIHSAQMITVASIIGKSHLTEMDLLRLQKALLTARMSADSTFLVNKTLPAYSSKLERLTELLGELLAETDRKIVLFSEWTTMLNLIEPILKANKAEFVRLDGKVPQKKRQMIVRTFQSNPDCRVFLTTNAGSVGLNLQAANTVVNVDLPWNPAVLEQRIGRAHRMGQKRHVQIFLLVTEQTIEEQMLVTLSAKHDLALAALDIDSKANEVMMQSGVEELKRRLEVLLGSKLAAPTDRSGFAEIHDIAEKSMEKTKKPHHVNLTNDQLVQAGSDALGSIVQAATGFLGALASQHIASQNGHLTLPASNGDNPAGHIDTAQIVETVQKAAAESIRLETDAEGKVRISLSLPERPVLDSLLQTAANLFARFVQ